MDFGIRKLFRVKQYQFSGQVDLFNVPNLSYVKSASGSSRCAQREFDADGCKREYHLVLLNLSEVFRRLNVNRRRLSWS